MMMDGGTNINVWVRLGGQRHPGPMWLVVLLLLACFANVGCGSLQCHQDTAHDHTRPVVYPILRKWDEINKDRDNPEAKAFMPIICIATVCLAIDTPFSLIADTFFLPFDLAGQKKYDEDYKPLEKN